MLYWCPTSAAFPQTIPATATAGPAETNKISWIHKAAASNSNLCSPLQLVQRLGNGVSHASKSLVIIFKIPMAQKCGFSIQHVTIAILTEVR